MTSPIMLTRVGIVPSVVLCGVASLLMSSDLLISTTVLSSIPKSSSALGRETASRNITSSKKDATTTTTTSQRMYPKAIYSPPDDPIIGKDMINLPRPDHPSSLIAPTFRTDDFSIGKSCKRGAGGIWECRDCHSGQKNITDWFECALMKPRNECNPILDDEQQGWDPSHAPRRVSMHDPLDAVEAHRQVVTHYGLNETYEQMPCESLEDCWDMRKCTSHELTVYGYGPTARDMARRASKLYPESIQWTRHPYEACLLLVTHNSFNTPSEMHSISTWNAGRNHFLWDVDQYFGNHGDRPFNTETNFDHASVASTSRMDANIRLGYDIPTSFMKDSNPKQFNFFQPQIPNLTLGRRPILVSFKGGMAYPWKLEQPWFQHRFLVNEYWEHAPDVFHDVQCNRPGKQVGRPKRLKIKRYNSSTYDELLLNSTFAFCPGGGAVGSYRFTEALSLGAIPVVTSEFVPPLAPEVDWRTCLVRISEARIVDIPRILRAKSDEEIQSRQMRCRYLFHAIWGWAPADDKKDGGYRIDSSSRIVPLALRIWSHRIQRYRDMREHGEALLSE